MTEYDKIDKNYQRKKNYSFYMADLSNAEQLKIAKAQNYKFKI